MKIYLALGSNIEPKKKYISQAINLLKLEFSKTQCSSIYLSTPYQKAQQDNYYNCVVSFSSQKKATEILIICQKIETKLGRQAERQKGQPRTIDIDILLYGDSIITSEHLIIPHYDLLHRDFFLMPLLELAPELSEPISGISLQDTLRNLPKTQRTILQKIPSI